jgi:hypothetical protein
MPRTNHTRFPRVHRPLRSRCLAAAGPALGLLLIVALVAGTFGAFEPEDTTLAGDAKATISDSSCALPRYPTPSCTGVPAGTAVTNTVNGSYTASTYGEVIDGWRITGDLVIRADNVTVKNTQVDGTISNDITSPAYHSTITDTTIGLADTCVVSPGIDTPNDLGGYTAQRVRIIGHDDGFRAGGPNITIRDSHVKNCGQAGSHGDGIQDYPAAQNLVFDHNTMDLCGTWTSVPTSARECDVPGHNGPIFVHSDPTHGSGSTNVTITDNLALGGVFTFTCTRPSAPGSSPETGW